MHEKLCGVWDYFDDIAKHYRSRGCRQATRLNITLAQDQVLSGTASVAWDPHTERNAVSEPSPRISYKDEIARPRTSLGIGASATSLDVPKLQRRRMEQWFLPNVQPDPSYFYYNEVYKVQNNEASEEMKTKNIQYKELFQFREITNAMQKLKTTDSESSTYHSHLESSLVAFHDKSRMPYDKQSEQTPIIKVHRPVTAPAANRTSNNNKSQSKPRPSSSMSTRSKRRPKSSPTGTKRKRAASAKTLRTEPTRVFTMTDYDHLSPDLTYSLSDGVQIESIYGVRVDTPNLSDDVATDDVGIDKVDDELKEKLRIAQEKVLKIQTPAIETFTQLYDMDIVADEEDNRPPTWAEQIMALDLRPEQLDLLHIREYPETDFRKFDYEVTNTLQPNYDFAFPFSEQFSRVDFREIASLSAKYKTESWTDHTKQRPVDEEEARVIDRMYRISQLAAESAETDAARKERASQNRLSTRTRLGARVITAKGWKERKCTPECMQQMCTGDCPDKRMTLSYPCDKCQEKDCKGDCSTSVYTSRSRSSEGLVTTPQQKTGIRHANCISCKYKHQTETLKAKKSHPKPSTPLKDSSDSVMSFTTARRRSGRASIAPHKSYYSQRRSSLTGNDSSREKLRLALSNSRQAQKSQAVIKPIKS